MSARLTTVGGVAGFVARYLGGLPLPSLAYGFLVALVSVSLLAFMAFTILLIRVAVVAALALMLLLGVGLAALGAAALAFQRPEGHRPAAPESARDPGG